MADPPPTPNAFTAVHRTAVVLLFLLIAQPTFENMRALVTGTLTMGDVSADVSASNMVAHVLAMVLGWIGLWWFAQRKRRGAYASIFAHVLGFTAVVTQTPEMLNAMPIPAIGLVFGLLFTATLAPLRLFRDHYS